MPQRDASDAYPLTLGEEPRHCPGVRPPGRTADPRGRSQAAAHLPEWPRHWRNPRVVVGTLPVLGGRVHLARREIEPGVGRWSYPGGFLEMGEAAAEGARRETEEETELLVEVGRLIGVYSRPHAGIVTIVYEAAVVGGRAEPAAETSEVRAFGPTTFRGTSSRSARRSRRCGTGSRRCPGAVHDHEPELYVEGDPE